jgi:uncharacterized protein DUF6457
MNAPHETADQGQADLHRTDEDARLTEWCIRLTDELGAQGLAVDLKAVLGLAGRAAHAVMRPAAPLTTFVVGYAAGLAAGSGEDSDAAVEHAIAVATRLCASEQRKSEQPESSQ